jgi:Flp pilus assembly protein TadG
MRTPPRLADLLHAVRARVAAFRGDRRGVSAVEFAMVLPLLVTLYLGGVELSQGISIDRKVTLTARTVADLVAQKRTQDITKAELNDIMNAAKAVASPYPSDHLKVIVSSVQVDANNVARVAWSESFNTVARPKNQTVQLPATLVVANTSVIWAEVSYAYTPTIGYVMTGTVNLKEQLYMRPRIHEAISCTECG